MLYFYEIVLIAFQFYAWRILIHNYNKPFELF